MFGHGVSSSPLRKTSAAQRRAMGHVRVGPLRRLALAVCGAAALAVSCSPSTGTPTPVSTPMVPAAVATPTVPVIPTRPPEVGPSVAPTATATPTPTSPQEPSSATAPSPSGLMDRLLSETLAGSQLAIDAIAETGDRSYIPVLTEFLRFPWLLDEGMTEAIVTAMAHLSGSTAGTYSDEQFSWGWWVEWIGRNKGANAPAGYADFRASIFRRQVDPAIGDFFYEGVPAAIRLEEIVWGGVERDGIPDLRQPPAIPARDAEYLDDGERVFGVSINGESRAYPFRIMNAHEMANDTLGGVPFVLAY